MSTAFAAVNLLLVISIFAFLPILIGVYVYRDAKRRNMNAPLWTIIAILAPSQLSLSFAPHLGHTTYCSVTVASQRGHFRLE